jgi:hypothetical protein
MNEVGEAFMKRISGNPQFQEAEKSGKAFVIAGRPSSVVDLSRYTPAELEIIEFLQKERGRPMTQGEIDFQLEMAKSILGPDLTG